MSSSFAPAPGNRSVLPQGGPAGLGPAGAAGTHPASGRGATGPSPSGRPGQPGSSGQRLLTLTRNFVVLFLEVEAGRRPRKQLAPLMTPMLYARLAEIWVRGGCPGKVIRVSLLSREQGHCDLIAIVRRGDRCGALSVRLLRVPGQGWLVDVVARPEDGQLPPPAYPVVTDEPDDEVAEIPPVTLGAYTAGADWFVPG